MKFHPATSRFALTLAAFAAAGGLLTTPSWADQVIPDDLIVQGSVAVGFDAVNNESFGVNTLVLKENNLRVFFNDTSTSAGFASNDWLLIANDQPSGGADYFGIQDFTGGKTGFRMDAGVPADALRIASNGKLGLRTATPGLDIHMNTSDTPGVRLEQNNSGGFTAQTWDVAGNEANFFVRDLTGGSKLPFRIRPGAPTSSLDIAASGFVGVGVDAPKAKLHVKLKDSDVMVNNVAVNDGVLVAPETYTPPGGGAPVFTLHVEGTAFVSQTLEIGSSRERKENIKDLELKEAEETLNELDPVHFNYKSTTQHQLGFIAEDVPDLVATESRKSLVPMSFIAVLTKVAQKHERKVQELEKTVVAQGDLIKAMAARLDALERGNSSAKTVSLPPSGERDAERRKKQDNPDVATSSKRASDDAPAQSAPPAPRAEVINNGR